MPLYKFGETDKFFNVIKTYPQTEFVVYDGRIFLNNQSEMSGALAASVPNVPAGHLNLYEMNVDRLEETTGRSIVQDVPDKGVIYPFVTKQGSTTAFKTISTSQYSSDFSYGDILSSSYPLSSSIERELFIENSTRRRISALKNTLNHYTPLSSQYQYNSSKVGLEWDKGTQAINLISIPSIFYGSEIKKGSVKLQFYISGTLVAEAQDKYRNGELIQVSGSAYAQANGSGSVAGVVLYKEGFLLLTGSWDFSSITRDYINDASNKKKPSWLYYGVGANDGNPSSIIPSSSYSLSFKGTQEVPALTMMAHANKGELNHSNNPTYIQYEQDALITSPVTGGIQFQENELTIKNMVSSSFADPTGSFQKETYISQVAIYDKDRNLIGVAKLATPVKKTEERDLTFKLKVDF
tara:strand:- start:4624 stop:5850 length:1227 start_codon:yes stop_codon:yes gene_type:complete